MRTVGETIDVIIRIKDKYKKDLYIEEIESLNNVCNLLENKYEQHDYIEDILYDNQD